MDNKWEFQSKTKHVQSIPREKYYHWQVSIINIAIVSPWNRNIAADFTRARFFMQNRTYQWGHHYTQKILMEWTLVRILLLSDGYFSPNHHLSFRFQMLFVSQRNQWCQSLEELKASWDATNPHYYSWYHYVVYSLYFGIGYTVWRIDAFKFAVHRHTATAYTCVCVCVLYYRNTKKVISID